MLRLVYLGVANAFAMLRLLPMGNRDKDVESLALRHQITVLQRQLGDQRPRCQPSYRASSRRCCTHCALMCSAGYVCWCAPTPCCVWHRDLLARRHATRSHPKRPGQPRTIRSIHTVVLRLARENPTWGYRRLHGEPQMLGITVAASTVWQMSHDAGIDPAPERPRTTWADFLRSQADVLLASDRKDEVFGKRTVAHLVGMFGVLKHRQEGETVNAWHSDVLTVAEVAARLRVSKMTIYRLVHAGELDAVRIVASIGIPATALPALDVVGPRHWPGPRPASQPASRPSGWWMIAANRRRSHHNYPIGLTVYFDN